MIKFVFSLMAVLSLAVPVSNDSGAECEILGEYSAQYEENSDMNGYRLDLMI